MNSQVQMKKGEEIILSLILLVYVVSFFLPVTDAGSSRAMHGYQAFFLGIASVIFLPQWMANLAFWVGCGGFGDCRWKLARNSGAVAMLLAVSQVGMWDDPPEIGYYLWASSMVLLTLASTVIGLRCQTIAILRSVRPAAAGTNSGVEPSFSKQL